MPGDENGQPNSGEPAEDQGEVVDKKIADDENVIRAICTPYHLDKKGRLKRQAFKQRFPTKGVSVYRSLILTGHECKARGKALSDKNKSFVGLARVSAGAVRAAEATVEDTRETVFYGHADVFVIAEAEGHAIEEGEPLPPELADLWDARIDAILGATTFFRDTEPESENWPGPDLAAA